jgi:ABC-2 type transport system permease protein
LRITRWWDAIVGELADLSLVDDLPLAYAVIAGGVVIAGGAGLTGNRLRAFNLTGDE